MASQEGHTEIVQALLTAGANQSVATTDGFTPLAVALQENKENVVNLLLEDDVKGRVKLPALHIAARKNDVKAAALLLQSEHEAQTSTNMIVNRTTESGFTPLHISSHYGNMGVATLLLNRGADVNLTAKNGIAPLHVAAKRGHIGLVKLLIDRSGKIDSKTRDGLIPLHCAGKGLIWTIRWDRPGGHDRANRSRTVPDSPDKTYLTSKKARSGHIKVIDLLIDNKSDIMATTKNGLTPLHMARLLKILI